MRLNLLARFSCRNPLRETSRFRLTTADTQREFPFQVNDSQSRSRSAGNTCASFDRLSCDPRACSCLSLSSLSGPQASILTVRLGSPIGTRRHLLSPETNFETKLFAFWPVPVVRPKIKLPWV